MRIRESNKRLALNIAKDFGSVYAAKCVEEAAHSAIGTGPISLLKAIDFEFDALEAETAISCIRQDENRVVRVLGHEKPAPLYSFIKN